MSDAIDWLPDWLPDWSLDWVMSVISVLEVLSSFAHIIVAGIIFVIGYLIARRQFKRRAYNTLVASLNLVEDEWEDGSFLRLYTLKEQPATEKLPDNRFLQGAIKEATKAVTKNDVFLALEPDARDVVHPRIVGAVSELNVRGLIAKANGRPVTRHTYLVGLTWEPYGLSRKLRIMIVREDVLMKHFSAKSGYGRHLRVKDPHHLDRINTLVQMADIRERELKEEMPVHERRVREVDWFEEIRTTYCHSCGAELTT